MHPIRTIARGLALTLAASGAVAALATSPTAQAAEAPGATGTNIVENFDTVPAPGWTTTNNSTPVGSISWFQGTATDATPTPGPFNSHEGANNAYIGANFNSTGSTGTISNWLITPMITGLSAGDTWSFYTRKPTVGGGQTDYPDRLEVRLAKGGSCNPGTGAASVGDFTTLLVSVNPTLVANVYPQSWTQYSGVIPQGAPTSGCLAFRYFVTGAGSLGSNSDYIGIDTFRYTHGEDPVVPDTTITEFTGAPGATVSASFTGSPDYAISGYECRLDGATWAACTSPVTYPDLAEGPHEFAVRAKAYSGNVDTSPAVRTFTVDTIAPSAVIDSAPVGTITTTEASVSFSSDDVDATYECRLDDGGWEECASPASFTGLPDGDHTIAVRATDTAGNLGAADSTSFSVDVTAPEPSITQAPLSPSTDGSATLEFSSDDEDATYECRLDDGDWATCTSPATFTDLPDGDHTISIRATDRHGNTSTATSTTFTVERPVVTPTGPKLTKIRLTAPKKVRSTKKFKATLTGLVPGAKVTVRWAGKTKRITVPAGRTKLTVTLKAPKVKKNKKVKLTATATANGKKLTATKKVKVRAKR
ncbi:choice-of-anchor J domain-containing protein [Nocardioides sp. Bht2]|uniref:choice-of-anchor J domain-containing protein n=1 Tax=Nocardioides sp. Bht2 TaxID=3392297 RepID=UPI0039B384E5